VTALAVWLERRSAAQAIRRAFPARSPRLLRVRNAPHLETLLGEHLIDALVVGMEAVRSGALDQVRERFPTLPLLLFAPVRSDDAATVSRLERHGGAVVVEGIDDPILARVWAASGFTGRRLAALVPLANELDLVEPLQQRAWEAIVRGAPARLSTAALARELGITRETLSRRFAAGSAPSLKTAIDGVRLVAAGQLLGSTGWRVRDAARLLGYSSESLLQRSARRLVGTGARTLGTLPPERILARLTTPRRSRWS
jgi:AraC-like DNA-binding protein